MLSSKRIKAIALWVAIIVLLSNLPPINFFIGNNQFHYRTWDYDFDKTEIRVLKPTHYNDVLRMYYGHKCGKELRSYPNGKLYRTFKIHWWQFWNWGSYLYHPRYDLKYLYDKKLIDKYGPPAKHRPRRPKPKRD